MEGGFAKAEAPTVLGGRLGAGAAPLTIWSSDDGAVDEGRDAMGDYDSGGFKARVVVNDEYAAEWTWWAVKKTRWWW